MLAHKVTQQTARGKVEAEYDHCVALDWSVKIMAIAHLSRRDQTPGVFERPASLKDLKAYLGSLKGRVILTFEESGFAHWLYLELLDAVDRIIICDPFRNPGFTSQSPLRLKVTEHTTGRQCDRMSEYEHLAVRKGEYFSLDLDLL